MQLCEAFVHYCFAPNRRHGQIVEISRQSDLVGQLADHSRKGVALFVLVQLKVEKRRLRFEICVNGV